MSAGLINFTDFDQPNIQETQFLIHLLLNGATKVHFWKNSTSSSLA